MTMAGSEVRVEVWDAVNRPVKGLTWDDRIAMDQTHYESAACAEVVWQSQRSLCKLASKQMHLTPRLQNAHLYSFRTKLEKNTRGERHWLP